MTLLDEDKVKVQNLTDSKVAYMAPETNVLREFEGQQTRDIPAGELRMLYSTKGGKTLIEDYLSVKSPELAKEFNISDDSFEHEYNWTTKDVDTVLQYGSLDALKDALEFGPEGIKDLIVDRAVQLKTPDNNKLSAIKEFTGRDVAKMIELDTRLDTSETEESGTRSRRVSSKIDAPASERRVNK